MECLFRISFIVIMTKQAHHTPVLLKETLEALKPSSGKKIIDATFGLGGHSKALAEAGATVLALDWDSDHVKNMTNEATIHHIQLVAGNYAQIRGIAEEYNFVPADGVLFDFGLSMEQIRNSGRGFSYEVDNEFLDMRINPALPKTAADIINSFSEDQLYEIFVKNAEEINSRAIAHAIVRARHLKQIQSTGDLKTAIHEATKSSQAIARIFQALRVEVNNEYQNIRDGLNGALEIISPNGIIAIITFHPSEDRIVKLWIREKKLKMNVVTGKKGQSFEKSAVLRIISK